MDFDDSESLWEECQRRDEEEQRQLLDHLLDLWELSGMLGKQESILVIAERCGLLTQFKQRIEANNGKHR